MNEPTRTTAPGPDDTSTPAGREHWDDLYRRRDVDQLSWTQPDAGMSAHLIDRLPTRVDDAIVDVGGGAGALVDHLLATGHRRITVLDVSETALDIARDRVQHHGHPPRHVEWTVADVHTWQPPRTYRLWHDRAAFHFLTDPADRVAYRHTAALTVEPGGYLVIGTFAADGPTHCSGLPVVRYRVDELAEQLAPEFAALTARDEHHRTPWGDEQHFTWLVLQRRRPERHSGTVPG